MAATAEAGKARNKLKQGLARGLVAGYPNKKEYVPRGCFQQQVTRATIGRCLPEARKELLDFVSTSATKIFAILLYGCFLPDGISLECALQTCKDGRLTDSKLPLPRHPEDCVCDGDRGFCRHAMVRYIQGEWEVYGWKQFYSHQWMFLAVEFEAGKFDYDLDEECILPIKLREGHSAGAFGDVREGELNPDHVGESRPVSRAIFEILIAADCVTHRVADLAW
jgi:hypothetical protein